MSEKGSSKDAEDDLVEVEDHDDYLMYLEDILKTVHKAYYELYDQVQLLRMLSWLAFLFCLFRLSLNRSKLGKFILGLNRLKLSMEVCTV